VETITAARTAVATGWLLNAMKSINEVAREEARILRSIETSHVRVSGKLEMPG
jgi:hypothetical protein